MFNQNKIYTDLFEYVQAFAPTYHLILQWDCNHRARTITVLEKRLLFFMSRVQREILGRNWYRYHIPFIGFGEINDKGEYHMHVLIKDSSRSLLCWKRAFNKVTLRAKRTPVPKNPYLQEITPGTEWRVVKYTTKQLKPGSLGNTYANSAIISSEYLFSRKKRGSQWNGRIL